MLHGQCHNQKAPVSSGNVGRRGLCEQPWCGPSVTTGRAPTPQAEHPCCARGACDWAQSHAGLASSLCALNLPTRQFQIILAYLQGQNVLILSPLRSLRFPLSIQIPCSDFTPSSGMEPRRAHSGLPRVGQSVAPRPLPSAAITKSTFVSRRKCGWFN